MKPTQILLLQKRLSSMLLHAPEACEWLVPATSGFKGVSYDLSQLPVGVLSNGQAGYNVSNGVISGTQPDYDYVFGVCADVGIPDTLGCTSQTAIPSKAAAYQIGDWANQDLWGDHCVQIGDIAQSAFKLLDPTNPVAGVTVTFAGGSSAGCPYARQLSLSFVCDPDYKGIEPIQTIEEPAICQFATEIKTAYGCPTQCKRGANKLLCSGAGTCGYNPNLEQAMCICDSGVGGPDCGPRRGKINSNVGTIAGVSVAAIAAVAIVIGVRRRVAANSKKRLADALLSIPACASCGLTYLVADAVFCHACSAAR
jgi:hypothetical protein